MAKIYSAVEWQLQYLIACKFFLKQPKQLVKTTSSFSSRTGPCGYFAVRASHSPYLIASRQAYSRAALLKPGAVAPGFPCVRARRARLGPRHAILGMFHRCGMILGCSTLKLLVLIIIACCNISLKSISGLIDKFINSPLKNINTMLCVSNETEEPIIPFKNRGLTTCVKKREKDMLKVRTIIYELSTC